MKQLFKIVCFVFGLFILIGLSSCKVSDSVEVDENPAPILVSLSPAGKASKLPFFTLTVTGSDFIAGSKIIFDGVEKETTYISPRQLSCIITSAEITVTAAVVEAAGGQPVASTSIPVLVRTPVPGGGDSGAVNFNLSSNHVFSTYTAIQSGAGQYFGAKVAVDGSGNLCLIYSLIATDGTTASVNFARSTDHGENWDPPAAIAEYDDTGKKAFPDCAIDASGNINVLYSTGTRLYFIRSTDDGTTWSNPKALSNESTEISNPVIAVDSDDRIHALWPQANGLDCYLYYRRSLDNTSTFSAPMNIYNGRAEAGSIYDVSITVDPNGGVHAAWTSWPNYSSRYEFVYSNYSHDNGATWNDSDLSFGVSNSPDLTADSGGFLHMVLASASVPFTYEIQYKRSSNDGESWDQSVNLTNDNGWHHNPTIKVDRVGNINICYDSRMFTRSLDFGATWSTPVIISDEAEIINIAIDQDGELYFVWTKDTSNRIYFSTTRR
ncbi:MAG: hypothetical protein GY757_48240 [bacterium]|nr:hypothetical protein [bacterium]